jgi:acetyl esterase/lipase
MADAQFTTEDRDYLHHGDRAMRLRLFRPAGPGPFSAVIDLHGGAWCNGVLEECQARDEVLARAGFVVAALDFRHGADGYPTSLIDINYAVRWIKAHAAELHVDPGRVALCGQSSGGHLAMLAAMRPLDPRYTALTLPVGSPDVDASVSAVALVWPVINPLSRYRHARRARDSATPPAWVGDIPSRHDLYWKTEAAMGEGNPLLALETAESVQTPAAIWIQGRPNDMAHDYRDPDSPVDANEPERFVGAYRRAGGQIELVAVDYATRAEAHLEPVRAFLVKRLAG